jgi:LPS export ABC transporter protein LptC
MRPAPPILFKLITAFLGGCIFLQACVNKEEDVKKFFERKLGVDEAHDIESFLSQGGKMKARLRSPLMYRYQDTLPRVEFPKTLHVDFYNDSTQIESQLDAMYGRYLEGKNKVFLKDSVVVFNMKNHETLHCKELWWDQNTQKFYTDKEVRVHTPTRIIYGVGLEAAQDFSKYDIMQVTGTIMVNDSDIFK